MMGAGDVWPGVGVVGSGKVKGDCQDLTPGAVSANTLGPQTEGVPLSALCCASRTFGRGMVV
jgi:hypothetical protein